MTDAIRLPMLAAIAALAVAACGPERPGEGPRTEVTRDQVEEGLSALGLSDASRMEWEESVIDGGVAVFTGVTRAGSDAPGRIGRFSIAAPRLEGGRTRFDALEAEDLVVEDDGQITRLERLLVDQPGPGLSQWFSDLMSGRAETDEAYDLPSRSAGDYTFAELSMSGMSIAPAEGQGAPTGRIARMALEDFDGQTLGRAVIEGLSFTWEDDDSTEFTLRLDEFSMTGLDALMVELMLNLDDDEDFAAMGGVFADAMSAWMSPTGAFETLRVRGFDMSAAGMSVVMPSLDLRYETRRDESIDILARMPSLRIAFSPDVMGEPAFAEAGQMLAAMGYEALEFALDTRQTYNPQTDRVTNALDDYRFELKDGLRMRVAQDISGVQAYADASTAMMAEIVAMAAEDPEAVDAMEENLMALYGLMQIHSLTFHLQDAGLIERAIAMNAQMQGVSPEEARMQAATMISLGIAMAGGMLPDGLALQFGSAISGFIAQGGTVEIAMAPAQPVGMDRLMMIGEDMTILSELGLSVRHIPPQ